MLSQKQSVRQSTRQQKSQTSHDDLKIWNCLLFVWFSCLSFFSKCWNHVGSMVSHSLCHKLCFPIFSFPFQLHHFFPHKRVIRRFTKIHVTHCIFIFLLFLTEKSWSCSWKPAFRKTGFSFSTKLVSYCLAYKDWNHAIHTQYSIFNFYNFILFPTLKGMPR